MRSISLPHTILIALCAPCLFGAAPLQAAGFVGEHVLLDAASGSRLYSARVELSEHGLRATNLLDGRVTISDFAAHRVWLVDRARRLVHEVPVKVKRATEPGRSGDAVVGLALRGGIFAPQACIGLRAGAIEAAVWRGRSAIRHVCHRDDGPELEAQWLDEARGLVVRVERTTGVSEELRDLRPLELSSERFSPPAGFRRVSVEQFRRGGNALESYAPTKIGVVDSH